MATCSQSVSVPMVMYLIPGGSPTHQLHVHDPFLVVALHTNYMTQITLRFKTSEHDSLPLVQHNSMKSSQSETLTHSVSPGPGVYIQYTYSGVQTIEDVLLTCPSSISGNCQVFHFTSYPCTCTSEHGKQFLKGSNDSVLVIFC